ncbi:cytochrome P450 [Streptomyces roseoverticillatus]|uniref:Cytochrome P450 n=1 Tax=Streptomyces roseoverticillatus TaxID=66429 RepID=A0ABV3J1P2_9ACTN
MPASPSAPLAAPSAVPAAVGRMLLGPSYMERRFARHGEVVPDWAPGFGRMVWLRDPQLIEQVLRAPGADLGAVGRLFGRAIGTATTLQQLSGEQHRAMRRVVVTTVRGDALDGCRKATSAAAQRMVDACPVGTPFRLAPLLDQALSQANVQAAVSIDDPRQLRDWSAAFLELRRSSARFPSVAHSVGLLPRYPPAARARRACQALIRAEVTRRRRAGAAHDDALGRLLAAESAELTDQALSDQIVSYMFGSQTSSPATAWVIERAVRRPGVWDRIAAEAAAGADDFPYTEAVIQEGLRLRPPITLLPWRLRRPCDLGGRLVPAGTWAVASIWDLHRRPEVYADPEAFRPERFLGARPPRGAWLPFGAGPHACVASRLSFLQIREMLHALARRGRLLPAVRRDEGIGHGSSIDTYPARGCRVVLHARP